MVGEELSDPRPVSGTGTASSDETEQPGVKRPWNAPVLRISPVTDSTRAGGDLDPDGAETTSS